MIYLLGVAVVLALVVFEWNHQLKRKSIRRRVLAILAYCHSLSLAQLHEFLDVSYGDLTWELKKMKDDGLILRTVVDGKTGFYSLALAGALEAEKAI